MYYKYIFVVLVYKNYMDMIECVNSIKEFVSDFKIVIVNSYYDEITENIIRENAYKLGCDYINVENKGYGYGNNRGIEYSLEKFKFDYLVVSNPDILIKKFDDSRIASIGENVIAPLIVTVKGKEQSPLWVRRDKIAEMFIYLGMKRSNVFLLCLGYGYFKILRILFLSWFRKSRKFNMGIYAAHGSFVIISNEVLKTIGIPYDENMFMFSEELCLAHTLAEKGIETKICKDIEIIHKEDGSINLSDINQSDERKRSYMYYYEKCRNIWRENDERNET